MPVPQTSVNAEMASGVPGEFAYTGPHRAQPYMLQSDGVPNIIGATAYTVVSEGVAMAGGVGEFAGILIHPKGQANYGGHGGLAPNMTLLDNMIGELLTMGTPYITLPNTAGMGDLLVFDNTTGALSSVARGTETPGTGRTFVPNGVVIRNVAVAGIAEAQLTN